MIVQEPQLSKAIFGGGKDFQIQTFFYIAFLSVFGQIQNEKCKYSVFEKYTTVFEKRFHPKELYFFRNNYTSENISEI